MAQQQHTPAEAEAPKHYTYQIELPEAWPAYGQSAGDIERELIGLMHDQGALGAYQGPVDILGVQTVKDGPYSWPGFRRIPPGPPVTLVSWGRLPFRRINVRWRPARPFGERPSR